MDLKVFVSRKSQCAAFTLIELLIVVAVIIVLVSLLMPTAQRMMDKSKQSGCLANLRNLGQVVLTYSADNSEILPGIRYNNPSRSDGDPWYVELDEGGYLPRVSWEFKKRGIMGCPSRTSVPTWWYKDLHYGMNFFPGFINGPGMGEVPFRLSRIAKPSRTGMIGEVQNQYLVYPWTDEFNAYPHNGHNNFVFFDGHVESVKGPLPQVITSPSRADVPYDGETFPFY